MEGYKITYLEETLFEERNFLSIENNSFSKLIGSIISSSLSIKQFQLLSHVLKFKCENKLSEYESNFKSLTNKELEVFEFICEGLVPKEIASKMFIEVSTAQTHRRNIIKKLNIKSFKDWCLYSSFNDLTKIGNNS